MTRILMLYYSYTNQTRRVARAMAETFRQRGCEVQFAEIQFTDARFDFNFPLRPFWRKMFKMIPFQARGRTGTFEVDQQVLDQDYDLICIGSPTWWLLPAMPVTSFLCSQHAPGLFKERPFAVLVVCRKFWSWNLRKVKRLAAALGGKYIDGTKFQFRGGQLRSMFSFINFVKNGEDRERFCGCRIYPFGVTEEGVQEAHDFAERLLEQLRTKTQHEDNHGDSRE